MTYPSWRTLEVEIRADVRLYPDGRIEVVRYEGPSWFRSAFEDEADRHGIEIECELDRLSREELAAVREQRTRDGE